MLRPKRSSFQTVSTSPGSNLSMALESWRSMVDPLTPLSAKTLAVQVALSAVSCRSKFYSVVETPGYPLTAIGHPRILLIPNDCSCETAGC